MKSIVLLIVTLIAVALLWPSPVLYPLKLLVVFFHEASHALATVASGGRVVDFVVDPMQGGQVISRGGSRFLTLSAGYLGSLVWGVVIYGIAVVSRYDKALMVVLGSAILAIGAIFVRDLFAIGFALVTGGLMILIGTRFHRDLNDLILRVIGLTSMLYVPLDIWDDTIARSELRSDARMLAEEFGGSGLLWGGAWLAISVAVVAATLLVVHRSDRGHAA